MTPTAPQPVATRRITQRGHAPTYRFDTTTHCPGCDRAQWHVGRMSAECAFCATAVPFRVAGDVALTSTGVRRVEG